MFVQLNTNNNQQKHRLQQDIITKQLLPSKAWSEHVLLTLYSPDQKAINLKSYRICLFKVYYYHCCFLNCE